MPFNFNQWFKGNSKRQQQLLEYIFLNETRALMVGTASGIALDTYLRRTLGTATPTRDDLEKYWQTHDYLGDGAFYWLRHIVDAKEYQERLDAKKVVAKTGMSEKQMKELLDGVKPKEMDAGELNIKAVLTSERLNALDLAKAAGVVGIDAHN